MALLGLTHYAVLKTQTLFKKFAISLPTLFNYLPLAKLRAIKSSF